MKRPAQVQAMEDNAARWEKFAALETDVQGIKTDIAGLDLRITDLGGKFDSAITRLFDRLESSTKKSTPWNIIFSFAGIVGTVILALSAWANAYFGQAISAAQREASQSMVAHGALQTQINSQRDTITALAIDAARQDERQKMTSAELDRLRGRCESQAHESPNPSNFRQ